jgi:Cysteine-rich secretory protein family
MMIKPQIFVLAFSIAAGCEALNTAYIQSDSASTTDEAVGSPASHSQNVNESEILAAHNKYRREVGVPALVWSDSIAASARQWADHLAATRSFKHSSSGYGENIWSGTTGSFSQTDMVDRWGSEQQYFVAGGSFPNVCRGRCGHYTQMIWRNTTAIGCGLATDGGRDYLVCRYNPPGNYRGRKPY